MNISTKLTLLMAVLLAGVATTAVLDLHEIRAMSDGARVVHFIDAVGATALRIDPAATGDENKEATDAIDALLDGLLTGDRGREVPRIQGGQMRMGMLAAQDNWLALKVALQGIRGAPASGEEVVAHRKEFLTQIRRLSETAMTDCRAREERHRLIVGVLAALSASLIMGAWRIIQKDVARPVARLAEKARQVSQGDLQVQFTIGEGDELDILAHCLDAMVSCLKERIRELSEAKTVAEASSRAKSEFLSRMGHELRTPLHAVIGYTDLLLDGVEGPISSEQRSSLSRVCAQGHHLLHLIDRLLTYARLSSEETPLHCEPFELQSVLGKLSHFATLSERKGLHYCLRVSPVVPEWLGGDETGLFEVLEGLVENAVKFTREGVVEIEVDRESEGTEAVCLHFTVRDTGIGIPADLHDDIFQAFSQGESLSTRNHSGIGLGLATAALWSRLIGGRLWVNSEPGQGSTFHLQAPFAKLESPSRSPRVSVMARRP